MKQPPQEAVRAISSRPKATVTIEPTGSRRDEPRDHSIHVRIDLAASDDRHSDREQVSDLARRALAVLSLGDGELHRPRVSDLQATRRASKAGAAPTHVVVGVEGTSVSRGRPDAEAIERLQAVLVANGYRVAVLEKRECGEPGCTVHAMMEWGRSAEVPTRWHSREICSAHNYRTCTRCKSTYSMTSVNSAGQAPSVHCEVCGLVIIEWGSSKIWTVSLVKRGDAPAE